MKLFKSLTTLAAVLVLNTANAGIISTWSVSDAAGNCSGGPHGLWTNSLNLGSGGCNDYFSIQSGSTLTQYDDGTAVLDATAKNPAGSGGYLADIDITFSGLQNYTDFGGTIKGAGLGDETTWSFFTTASGTITINSVTYSLTSLAGSTAFQLGQGANDKTTDFGASSWINMGIVSVDDGPTGPVETVTPLGYHWDLNLDLAVVPEPSILLLFGAGLLGLGLVRRRRISKL